jgi:hypothetical protein
MSSSQKAKRPIGKNIPMASNFKVGDHVEWNSELDISMNLAHADVF